MFEEKKGVICINGADVAVNPDFRVMCRYSVAVDAQDVKMLAGVARDFYFAGLPDGIDDVNDAIYAMGEFYAEGLSPKGKGGKSGGRKAPRCFDFSEDEGYFYSAFLSEYGIDLNAAKLHWYDFCAFFRGLPDSCRLRTIMGVRAVNLADVTSKSERERLSRLKKIYSLHSGEKKKPLTLAERDEQVKRELLERHAAVRKLCVKQGEVSADGGEHH